MLGNAAEKIDFLMRLTNTQNAVLAHGDPLCVLLDEAQRMILELAEQLACG